MRGQVRLIYLEPRTGGGKVGLDDFFAAGHTSAELEARATAELRPAPLQETSLQAPYRETPQGIVWHKPTKDGVAEIPLTNFCARIVGEIFEDDGVERRLSFEVKAKREKQVVTLAVPARSFPSLAWVVEALGAQAIVCAGQNVKDHARAAIQWLSTEIAQRVVFAHLGWRRIGERWLYLHAGGAIGPNEAVPGIEVSVPPALDCYELPHPPEGQALHEAIDASLQVLAVARESLSFPGYAAIWRAILGEPDFSIHVAGRTNT